jgi:hypothetical protein
MRELADALLPAACGEQIDRVETVERPGVIDLDMRDLAFGEAHRDQEDRPGPPPTIGGDRVEGLGPEVGVFPPEAAIGQAEEDGGASCHRLSDLMLPILARQEILIPPGIDFPGDEVLPEAANLVRVLPEVREEDPGLVDL